MEHVGWFRYCKTFTSLDTKENHTLVEPWLCNFINLKDIDGLYEDDWKYFYVKAYKGG